MTPFSNEGARPNLFLVGAPKCGTSSMASYLGSHPGIFMTEPKEPNFFCEDLPGTRGVTTLSNYMELFPDQPSTVMGEASTWYLYSEVAVHKIRKFNPSAKLLVMVRNPVEMAYSLHSQLLYNQIEWVQDFEEAWALQNERATRNFLQYRRVASLGSQLQRLLSIFPREQVRIVVFDDFVANTGSVYRETIRFLGLTPDDRTNFPVINRNTSLRSRFLARFVRSTPKPFVQFAQVVKRAFGVEQFGLLNKLQEWNAEDTDRPALDSGFRRRLVDEFSPEVDKLEGILGRELSEWKHV